MPVLKKVVPARTMVDVDAGLMAVAQEYKKQREVKSKEIQRVNELLCNLYNEDEALRLRVEAVELAIGAKVFNANL